MITDHLVEISFLTIATLGVTCIGLAIGWARARARALRAEGFIEGMRAVQPQQQGLSPAIDAIAMEVERIGEGQRFLTKVLAEEPTLRGKLPRSSASITPH